MGVNIFFCQNVAVTPGGNTATLEFGFPPAGMVGHVGQHVTECRAHVVLVLPDVPEHCSPRVSRVTVSALVRSKAASSGHLHHQDGVRDNGYVRHGTRSVEVGSRNGRQKLTARGGGITGGAHEGGRRIHIEIPVRKDVAKLLPATVVRKNID